MLVGVVALAWAAFQKPAPVFELARNVIREAQTARTVANELQREPLPEVAEFFARLANDTDWVAPATKASLDFDDGALRTIKVSTFTPLVTIKRRPFEDRRKSGERGMDVPPYLEDTAVYGMSRWSAEVLQIAKDTDVAEFATLGDVETRSRQTLELPGLGERVRADRAVGLIAIGLIAPLLYLLSISGAVYYQVREEPTSLPISFLPFHPGGLGAWLTCIWLLSPAAIAWVAGLGETKSAILRFAAGPLTFIAVAVGARLIATRHAATTTTPSRYVKATTYLGITRPNVYWGLSALALALIALLTGDLEPIALRTLVVLMSVLVLSELASALGPVGFLGAVVGVGAGACVVWYTVQRRRARRDASSRSETNPISEE